MWRRIGPEPELSAELYKPTVAEINPPQSHSQLTLCWIWHIQYLVMSSCKAAAQTVWFCLWNTSLLHLISCVTAGHQRSVWEVMKVTAGCFCCSSCSSVLDQTDTNNWSDFDWLCELTCDETVTVFGPNSTWRRHAQMIQRAKRSEAAARRRLDSRRDGKTRM